MPRLLKLGIPPYSVARAQARELVRRVDALAMESAVPAVHIEVVQVRAPGETASGLFVAAEGTASSHVETLRKALSRGQVDVVLHHLAERPGALRSAELAAILERGPQHDALLGPKRLRELPASARVAVGSMRSRALLRNQRPDLQPVHLRGGPGTCIDKLRHAAVDALLLPLAIVAWQDEMAAVREQLSPEDFVPGAGQGSLALEVRHEDPDLLEWAQQLEHLESRLCVAAELAFAERIGAALASGVHANIFPEGMSLLAFASGYDGEGMIFERSSHERPLDEPQAVQVGAQLADSIHARWNALAKSADRH